MRRCRALSVPVERATQRISTQVDAELSWMFAALVPPAMGVGRPAAAAAAPAVAETAPVTAVTARANRSVRRDTRSASARGAQALRAGPPAGQTAHVGRDPGPGAARRAGAPPA